MASSEAWAVVEHVGYDIADRIDKLRAKEREDLIELARQAVLDEREACAKLCANEVRKLEDMGAEFAQEAQLARFLRDAIRARSTPSPTGDVPKDSGG